MLISGVTVCFTSALLRVRTETYGTTINHWAYEDQSSIASTRWRVELGDGAGATDVRMRGCEDVRMWVIRVSQDREVKTAEEPQRLVTSSSSACCFTTVESTSTFQRQTRGWPPTRTHSRCKPHKSHKRSYLTTFRSRYREPSSLWSYSPWRWIPCIETEASSISTLSRRNSGQTLCNNEQEPINPKTYRGLSRAV